MTDQKKGAEAPYGSERGVVRLRVHAVHLGEVLVHPRVLGNEAVHLVPLVLQLRLLPGFRLRVHVRFQLVHVLLRLLDCEHHLTDDASIEVKAGGGRGVKGANEAAFQ